MLLDVHREVMKFSSKHFLRDRDSKSFNVNFHGVNLQFRFRSEALLEELRSYFPKTWWLTDKESCPLLVVHWSAPSEFSLCNIEQWAQLSSPDCYETSFFDDSWVVQRDFMARELGSEESVTTLCLLSSPEVNDGLFNFLRYYLPKYLLPLKKILLHSSCVLDENNEAYLFLGPSGAGKTTMTELCRGAQVLGDDMNLISFDGNGQLMVEPALFGQQYFSFETFGKSYPVRRMHWLKQGGVNRIYGGLKADLIKMISCFSGLSWEKMNQQEMDDVFQFMKLMRKSVAFKTLEFSLEGEVWDCVRTYE